MFVKMRLTDFCCCFNDIGNSFLTQLKYVYTSMLINVAELEMLPTCHHHFVQPLACNKPDLEVMCTLNSNVS